MGAEEPPSLRDSVAQQNPRVCLGSERWPGRVPDARIRQADPGPVDKFRLCREDRASGRGVFCVSLGYQE